MKPFLIAIGIGIASIANLARADAPRPNILLILCDDLGYADVGFNADLFGVETDVGESADLSKENAEALEEMIASGREWSTTLQDPQWHDTQAGLDSWRKNGMPQYEKTFSVR